MNPEKVRNIGVGASHAGHSHDGRDALCLSVSLCVSLCLSLCLSVPLGVSLRARSRPDCGCVGRVHLRRVASSACVDWRHHCKAQAAPAGRDHAIRQVGGPAPLIEHHLRPFAARELRHAAVLPRKLWAVRMTRTWRAQLPARNASRILCEGVCAKILDACLLLMQHHVAAGACPTESLYRMTEPLYRMTER
jgi:hypothetical protein